VSDVRVIDITDLRNPAKEPLPGFQEIHPMVFSGIYPINTADFEHLKTAIGKLRLNDAAFVYQPESSVALGFGFRCGFLGLLHMEIIQERLRREYDMDIIATSPSVIYEVLTTRGEILQVDNPAHLPDPSIIEEIREPIVRAYVLCPNESIGDILQLILEKRGTMDHTETLDARRVMLHCELPLNEILVDFNDKIKSITRGYGSMDYEHAGHRADKLVKLDLLVNGEPIDAFSMIVHRDRAEARGRQMAAKLKEVIPNQLYQVAIQAAIAALHADARRTEETDWVQIVGWYDELLRLTESPVVQLNRAIAIGEADGPVTGLAALAMVDPGLPRHSAASAYLHEKAGDILTAGRLYADAARSASNLAERHHLTRQAARINQAGDSVSSGASWSRLKARPSTARRGRAGEPSSSSGS